MKKNMLFSFGFGVRSMCEWMNEWRQPKEWIACASHTFSISFCFVLQIGIFSPLMIYRLCSMREQFIHTHATSSDYTEFQQWRALTFDFPADFSLTVAPFPSLPPFKSICCESLTYFLLALFSFPPIVHYYQCGTQVVAPFRENRGASHHEIWHGERSAFLSHLAFVCFVVNRNSSGRWCIHDYSISHCGK